MASGIDAKTGERKSMSDIIFDKFDTDGSGGINKDELKQLCYELGHCLSEEQLELACQQLDADGSGSIDKAEFQQWWKTNERFKQLQFSDYELTQAKAFIDFFHEQDADWSGQLSREEFGYVHESLVSNGYELPEFESVLQQMDVEQDGDVELNEFVSWCCKAGLFKQ